jgi:2-oxoglutarate ferredoxin oxidoreductase subunit gamma
LDEHGILITEEDLIQIDHQPRKGIKHFTVPATRLAEELGKKMVLNIVMVGFFTAVTNLIHPDAMENAVRDSVPKGTEELNLKAFKKGFDYGKEVLSKTN